MVMEAQEIEAILARGQTDNPGPMRVEMQPDRAQDPDHPGPGLLGPDPAGAEDHEVIGVADQHPEAAHLDQATSNWWSATLANSGHMTPRRNG